MNGDTMNTNKMITAMLVSIMIISGGSFVALIMSI